MRRWRRGAWTSDLSGSVAALVADRFRDDGIEVVGSCSAVTCVPGRLYFGGAAEVQVPLSSVIVGPDAVIDSFGARLLVEPR